MKHVLSLTLCLISTLLISQKQSSVTVLFDSDSDVLSAEYQDDLIQFADLYYTPGASVRIVGHTDQDGSSSYNMDLSKRRAATVSDFFNGLEVETTELDFSGEKELKSSSESEEAKQRNRRVEIFFVDNYHPDTQSLDDLKRSLIPEAQVHWIDNDKDTVLVCDEGTTFRFPAACFETFDGPMVKLEVREALDLADMYLCNLGTEGGPNMLSSGGMLTVQAFQQDVQIDLRAGQNAVVYMPTDDPQDDMELYFADSDGTLQDWEKDEAEVVISRPFIPREARAELIVRQNTEKCKFFWCRLGRAFTKKENRTVLDEDKNYVVTEYDRVYQTASTIPTEEKSMFGDEETQQIWAAIHEANTSDSRKSYYAFPARRLNWINCDVLRPAFQEDVLVKHGRTEGAMEITMMFPRDNGITRQYGAGATTKFRNMPKLKKTFVICLKVEDKQPYLAMTKTRVTGDKIQDFEYVAMSPEEIGKAIKDFIN
jgi:hypothetical protein